MVSTIVYQLTDGLSPEEIKASGYDKYFVDHTLGVYPQAASGTPFSADTFQSTGDTIADLYEDMAAEQKIVHFQRFGEAMRIVCDHLDSKNYYMFNPSFDS